MGTPEIVVKRAWPCSSRFTPVGAPIGRSGAFSRLGRQSFLGPLLFRVGRMAVLEYICDGTLGNLWFLIHAIPGACLMIGKRMQLEQDGTRCKNDRSVGAVSS